MSSTSSTLPASSAAQQTSPFPLAIILTVLLLVLFFVIFFSIYFCKCVNGWHMPIRREEVPPENTGMDPKLVQIFPTFTYSAVMEDLKHRHNLECVICLTEVRNEDLIRLITVCYHYFHQECIDQWLESHKTCPVCRRQLDLPKETLEEMTNPSAVNGEREENNEVQCGVSQEEVRVAIDVVEGQPSAMGNVLDLEGVTPQPHTYSRSHTTGHSLMEDGKGVERVEYDKYMLRLPPHVMARIRGHGNSLSCTAIAEFSKRGCTS